MVQVTGSLATWICHRNTNITPNTCCETNGLWTAGSIHAKQRRCVPANAFLGLRTTQQISLFFSCLFDSVSNEHMKDHILWENIMCFWARPHIFLGFTSMYTYLIFNVILFIYCKAKKAGNHIFTLLTFEDFTHTASRESRCPHCRWPQGLCTCPCVMPECEVYSPCQIYIVSSYFSWHH